MVRELCLVRLFLFVQIPLLATLLYTTNKIQGIHCHVSAMPDLQSNTRKAFQLDFSIPFVSSHVLKVKKTKTKNINLKTLTTKFL